MSAETSSDGPVMAVIEFKLRPGAERDELLEAMHEMCDFVSGMDGFVGERLLVDFEGDTFIDVVTWADRRCLAAAGEALGASPLMARVMAVTDPDSVKILHTTVAIEVKAPATAA